MIQGRNTKTLLLSTLAPHCLSSLGYILEAACSRIANSAERGFGKLAMIEK